MLKNVSPPILIIVLLHNKPFKSNGLTLPETEFIQEFAMRHDLNHIFIHMPFPSLPQQLITSYCKNKIETKIMMKCITSKHLENLEKLVFQNQDLHVFVLSANDLLSSFETFKRIFNDRKRSRKEYWILDISYSNDPEQLLEELYLDLDDDLYLFENKSILGKSDQDAIIFETYRLQDELPSKLNYYAKWSHEGKNLDILNTNKWVRRRDLTGVKFKCNAMPLGPYIKKMIPKSKLSGEYQVEGSFSDVFNTLQVSLFKKKKNAAFGTS